MQKRYALIALIMSFLFSFCDQAYAVLPDGYGYLGLMLGPGQVNKNRTVFADGDFAQVFMKPSNNPFAFRVYGGYNFTAYAGFEIGLDLFSKVNYEGVDGTKLFCCDVNGCSNKRPYAYIAGLDILGKLIAPLGPVQIYAKGGVIAAFEESSADFNPGRLCHGKQRKERSFRPMFSIGAGYDLNQRWVFDISYNQVQTKGIIDNINFWAIGVSYHFVNVYCGQFLCDDV